MTAFRAAVNNNNVATDVGKSSHFSVAVHKTSLSSLNRLILGDSPKLQVSTLSIQERTTTQHRHNRVARTTRWNRRPSFQPLQSRAHRHTRQHQPARLLPTLCSPRDAIFLLESRAQIRARCKWSIPRWLASRSPCMGYSSRAAALVRLS